MPCNKEHRNILNAKRRSTSYSDESKTESQTSFVSDVDENVLQNVENPNEKATKRQRHCWLILNTFGSYDEAHGSLINDGFSRHKTDKLADGSLKITYRCKAVKKRGQQCAAKRYMLQPSDNMDFQIFHNDCDHDHDDLKKK